MAVIAIDSFAGLMFVHPANIPTTDPVQLPLTLPQRMPIKVILFGGSHNFIQLSIERPKWNDKIFIDRKSQVTTNGQHFYLIKSELNSKDFS